MKISKKEYTFSSASGLADIYAESYTPENPADVRAVVQIAHGMAEHIERYTDFANYLCSKGFAVFMNDHLGHGKSISDESELGYFGEKDGYRDIVNDMKTLSDIAKTEYPDIPFIIFGHSMGSFLARSYCEKYGALIDGAVFSGTSGSNPATPLAIKLASFVAKQKGSHYRSDFINTLAFGNYNKRFEGRTPFDWLTRDENIVDKYIEDPHCGFLFTAAGFKDLFSLLKSVSSKSWYESIPYSLPILLISGAVDPVGDYSKGVAQVYKDLKDSGHKDVTLKLYDNSRHEVLNEISKDVVFADVADWISKVVSSKNAE
ncbi:MAG: alpha/beta hydrolase [Clostridiales bacterium]|nr:alpha/beta hydrolase [Clostridiales bacterium]